MPRRVALAAMSLLLLACAGSGAVSSSIARAPFSPGHGDVVFERAISAMLAAGYRLRSCDADRWLIETGALELDAPCGRTTCLARQSIEVKLGYRAVRVRVDREVFDGALRLWREADTPASADAARALALQIARAAEDHRAGATRQDPCALAKRMDVSAARTAP